MGKYFVILKTDFNSIKKNIEIELTKKEFDKLNITSDNNKKIIPLINTRLEVKDVIRYEIEINEKKEVSIKKVNGFFNIKNNKFNDLEADLNMITYYKEYKKPNYETILMILESPHLKEYICLNKDDIINNLTPISPSQGQSAEKVGEIIEKHLNKIIFNLNMPIGKYIFIISNPIPFHTSLGYFYNGNFDKKLRNKIWIALWNDLDLSIKKHFIDRIKLYSPSLVLNCCNKVLQTYITELLSENQIKTIYKGVHFDREESKD